MHRRQSRAPVRCAGSPPYLRHCSFESRAWVPPPAHDRTLLSHRADYHRRLRRVAAILAVACIALVLAAISSIYLAWLLLRPYLMAHAL